MLPARSRTPALAASGVLLAALLLPAVTAVAAAPPPPAPAAAPAAPAAPPPPATFRASAEVSVVEIPVQVVRDGLPVRGLTRADFTVWQGKTRQELVGFETVDLGLLGAAGGAQPAPLDLPVAGRRHILFLFDLSHADPKELARAQDAALGVARSALTAADLAAVAVYSPAHGARVLLAFTSDRRQVELALTTLGSSELVEHHTDWLGLVLGQERNKAAAIDAQHFAPPGAGNEAKGIVADVAVQRYKDLDSLENRGQNADAAQQARAFARSLQDLAVLMQRVDGRKHVVFLSTGFDSTLLVGNQRSATRDLEVPQDEQAAVWRSDSDVRYGDSRVQGALRATIEEMRRADCVVHAVDIGHGEASSRAITSDVGEIAAQQTSAERTGEESLFALAQGTGGALYRNYNDAGAAMRKVLDASALTYVLTIATPPARGYVPLRVEVRGAKASEVSYRPGFFASPPPAQQQALAERLRIGAQLLEGRSGGSVHAAVLGVPTAAGDGPCALVEVDGPSLLAGAAGDIVSGEVTLYAFTPDGHVAAVVRQLVGLDLRVVGDRLRHAGFQLFAPLTLAPGRYELRALVRNTITGAYGIAKAPLEVPAASAAPSLVAVFAQPAEQAWLLVRNQDAGARAAAYPFVVGEHVVTPALAPRLHAGEAGTLWLRVGSATGLVAEVRREDGSSAGALPVTIAEREPVPGAGEALLATVTPARLPAGSYTLELRTASAAAVSIPFRIE